MKARALTALLTVALAVSAIGLPAATQASVATHRTPAAAPAGGTLKIEYTTDFITLDPALALDLDGWMTVWSVLFDQLYRFDHLAHEYPDVAAAMPTISNGGTVYSIP